MIKLGNKVECKVTGFKGIVTGRCEYLNGCVQYLIRPKVKKTDKETYPKGTWIDAEDLNDRGKGISIKTKPTGGDRKDAPTTIYQEQLMSQSKQKRPRECKTCGRSYKMTGRDFAAHQNLHVIADKARNAGFTDKTVIKWDRKPDRKE